MAKFADDAIMNLALDSVKASTKRMTVCAGQPATFASATTQGAQMLAQVITSAGSFGSTADGDSSGRKIAVSQHSGIEVSATGGGNHVVLLTSTAIKYITTATSQTLTDGNTLTVNAWDIEIADPT